MSKVRHPSKPDVGLCASLTHLCLWGKCPKAPHTWIPDESFVRSPLFLSHDLTYSLAHCSQRTTEV